MMEETKKLPEVPVAFERQGDTEVKGNQNDSSLHGVERKALSAQQGLPDGSTRCSLLPDSSTLCSSLSETSSASLLVASESSPENGAQLTPTSAAALQQGGDTPQGFTSRTDSLAHSGGFSSPTETIPSTLTDARSADSRLPSRGDGAIESTGECHPPAPDAIPSVGGTSPSAAAARGASTAAIVKSPVSGARGSASSRASGARLTGVASPIEERSGNRPAASSSSSSWAPADTTRGGRAGVVAGAGGMTLRLARASDGSFTVVDNGTGMPAREWVQQLQLQAADPTPILRLRVHPETGEVTRTRKRTEDGERQGPGGPDCNEEERSATAWRSGPSYVRQEFDDGSRSGSSRGRPANSSGPPGPLMRPPSLSEAFSTAVATTHRFRYRSTSVAGRGRGSSRGPTDQQLFERDTYTDIVHSSEDSGLTWGEKRAKDGSWREKWMQQTMEEEEEDTSEGDKGEERGSGGIRTRRTRRRTFGQNHGINESRRERWSERWEEVEGRRRTVEKAVQQLDEDGNVVQEWFEVIEENLETGETKVTKAGEDSRAYFGSVCGPQSPREELGDHRERGTTSSLSQDDLNRESETKNAKQQTSRRARLSRRWKEESHRRVSAETGEDEVFWSVFEESQGGREKGRRRRRDRTKGTEETEVWYRAFDSETGETMETWEERWIEKADGEKWGEKKGVNTQKEEWGEKWRENAAGEREVDRWARTEDGRRQWGEKKGRGRPKKDGEGTQENGCEHSSEERTPEDYTERWEIEHRDDAYVSFTDRWWERPEEGSRWGEKKKVTHTTLQGPPNGPNAEDETGATDRVVELNEKWYDNGQEKMVDEWRTELLLESAADDNENGPRRILHQVKSGRKHTNRYCDGTQWGENWHQSQAASPGASSSSSSATDGNVDSANEADGVVSHQVTVQIRTPSGRFEVHTVEASAPVLRLASTSRDSWWREPHGNSWGEKMYHDLEQGSEQHEKWYDNGHERQVDRWRVAPDGSRTGEKFGSKTDGTEWREAWGRQASGEGAEEDSWIEKRWKERNRDGEGVNEWGETEGSEGRKRWNQKWWKKESWHGGDEFVEKWEDDGHGNKSTVKLGSTWKHREGCREVTDWFEDKFGEVAHSQEKWAYKRGHSASGDNWLEKWNERPEEKSATKSGSNARGDEWSEQWKETFDENGEKSTTWAEKTGRNAQGDAWYETWLERRSNWKMAIKEGRNARGEEWQEKWGEDLHEDGSGEKWCQKWAKDNAGNRHGKSWGDRWGKDGKGGHRWGEEWSNDDVNKWWHDTDGRPAGC
ncbi:putative at hook motif protein [Toxoplasma gondii VAND]|uniref:Putative at hook motif protein n=1 Tax=Toxoplasma gondii VAND TaxID=933077 RepID=A0A086PJM5_TOXGO|nr:putative at hook motif protein [Toxoplasma gondii VAND]